MIETAHAKLNLALHVRAREGDGYHRIETLFAFCVDGDTVEAGGDAPLTIAGPFAAGLSAGPDNLVRRAADGMAATFGIPAPPLRLAKRLPVAAGIGGGSADAAAAIRLMCRLHGIDPADTHVTALARRLGADVPACVASRAVRGDRRGDRLHATALAPAAGTPVLLVNPAVPLSTAAVFCAWDGVDRGPLTDDPAMWRNDLAAPACTLVPQIGALVALLAAQAGTTLARMSGSGATCFAVFVDHAARDDAARVIAAHHPDYWTMATTLRD